MVEIIIKIVIALFIWWVLPSLIIKKKSSPWKRWVYVVCTIVAIVILVYAGVDVVHLVIGK